MKNLFLKTLAISLFLLAMPMRQYGQNVRNHAIELEVESIANPDYRFCLMSAIANDSNLNYSVNEDYMSVLVTSAKQWTDDQFQSYFNGIRNETEASFNEYLGNSKEIQGEVFTAWKEDLPQDLYVLLFKQMLIENPTSRDGNQTCATSEPFCTIDGITFHVDANPSGSCEPGPAYGCLSSYTARRPYWYHMKIAVAGNFRIQMTNSANVDIDYCCWGPFDDPVTPCPNQLQNIVDCGSTGAATEYCDIPSSAQVGKYYIMVITKWNQSTPTDITFQKVPNSGPGETDCGILPGVASNDGPYCVGDVIQLHVNTQEGATYSWTGPSGYTSNQQNPTRPNCTLSMAGPYTCVTTVGTHSVSATTNVQVSAKPTANFTATTVCVGETTQFNNSSTTNPSNQTMTYLWNFGDGLNSTSTQQNPTHQYAEAGNYTVTLTASCGSSCVSTKTQTVTVYANPVANAGSDQTVIYGATATLNGSGGSGTFNYHWEPADKVVNANAQTTQTVGLTESTTFTLTVTHPQGGCSSTDQVSILVEGSNMTATASATPNSICDGDGSQLQATAIGGTQNYTYQWTPTLGLSAPNIANPIAHPNVTTTYTCVVSDGMSTQTVTTTVTVNYPEYSEEEQYICPGESFNFYGQEYSEEGNYDYITTTAQGCEKIITLHLHHYPSYPNAHTTTAYICPGTSYNFHGNYYSTTGMHPHTLQTIHGCDSIVWLNLTVYPVNDTIPVVRDICIGQSYEFHGTSYTENTDICFDTIDDHGCLLVERLMLSVGQYQSPPNYDPNKYICYDTDGGKHYHWDIANRDYYDDANDSIIIAGPPGECDYKYMLYLKFHPEFYHTESVTECDEYVWEVNGQHYTATNHHIQADYYGGGSNFNCDSTYVLDLTINHKDISEKIVTNQCDQYEWQFGWHNESYLLTSQGNYTDTIDTHLGCDSIVTLKLQLDYSPTFERVEGKPWVVGGSEFQYTVENYWIETHPLSTHSTEWSLYKTDGTPFNKWEILPYDNGDKCLLYIYTFERDSIELRARTWSTGECDCGEYLHSKWIHCGYHGVNETLDPRNVDIYPNPNDGNMTLAFDNMEGETLIKVYTITGTLVDQLTIHNELGHESFTYQSGKLTPGIYFFNIINKKGTLTKKVIIID